MNIYTQLILLSLIVIYIVGVSGFTTSWRTGIAGLLGTTEDKLRDLKPFDCSQCMTWWSCLLFCLCAGEFNLSTIAFSGLMALLSFPISSLLIFIREAFGRIVDKLMDLL